MSSYAHITAETYKAQAAVTDIARSADVIAMIVNNHRKDALDYQENIQDLRQQIEELMQNPLRNKEAIMAVSSDMDMRIKEINDLSSGDDAEKLSSLDDSMRAVMAVTTDVNTQVKNMPNYQEQIKRAEQGLPQEPRLAEQQLADQTAKIQQEQRSSSMSPKPPA